MKTMFQVALNGQVSVSPEKRFLIHHSFISAIPSLLLLGFMTYPVVMASDSVAYRGPENNGIYQETGLLKSWPSDGPKLLWKQSPGSGTAYAGPSVSGTMVWIMSKNDLCGLELETGEIKKKYVVGGMGSPGGRFSGARCTPLIRNGVAVVVSLNSDTRGIDLATGASKWKVNAWKDFGSGKGKMGWGFPSSLTSFEEKVILNTAGKDDVTPPIVAVDFDTGKTVWQADPGVAKKYSCGDHSAAVFNHNGRWLNVNPTWRYIVCLDPRDGKKIWEIPDRDLAKGSEKAMTPVYGNGYLLFDSGALATCVKLSPDGSTYTPLWARQYGGQTFSHAVIIGKRAYLAGSLLQGFCQGPEALTKTNGQFPQIQPPKPAKNAITSNQNKPVPPPPFPKGLLCVDVETGMLLDIIRMKDGLGHVVSADGMVYALEYISLEGKKEKPSLGPNVFLIEPNTTGMDVKGQFRPPMTAEDWKVKDMDWQANIPPVISHGRLLIRYGQPLWTFDLRPGKDQTAPISTPVPDAAYWDFFLRGVYDGQQDLLVTIETKDGSVVAGVVAATAYTGAFESIDTSGLKVSANGLSGAFSLTLNPKSPNTPDPSYEITITAQCERGKISGTYTGAPKSATSAGIIAHTKKPNLDGRVSNKN